MFRHLFIFLKPEIKNVVVNKRFLVFIGLFLFITNIDAQQKVVPRNAFFDDTIKVGQPFKISLSCATSSASELFFPDSSYDFSPFEFVGKRFTPTKTKQGKSYDSVVYELVTFEVKKVQNIALPVFMLKEDGDTTAFFAAPDSVHIAEKLLDNQYLIAPVRPDTSFSALELLTNHPYKIIIVTISIIFLGIILLLLRGKISKLYLKLRLKISTSRFIHEFETMCSRVETSFSAGKLQETLVLWKKFLEDIEHVPLSSMTGKEIASHYRNRKLRTALESVDKCIYGTRKSASLTASLKTLGKFAEERAKSKMRIPGNV